MALRLSRVEPARAPRSVVLEASARLPRDRRVTMKQAAARAPVLSCTKMLQAQIDIVDEAGHTEESVTILGSGRVSLGARPTGGYLHADEAAPDLAVIAQDGERVWIQVKVANALQRDNTFIATGAFDFSLAQPALIAFVLHLRRFIKVQQTVVSGELMSGGAVIHSTPSSLT